jgi:hypothetical protein
MTIVEEIQKELIEKKELLGKSEGFEELQEFYTEMQELGIAKKPQYDLPPIDTIGRHLYEVRHTASKKKMLY